MTDDEWVVMEPSLPLGSDGYGRWRAHRHVINGIPHRPGTRCQWRKLPDRFGSWQTVHKRHVLWSADGTGGAAVRRGRGRQSAGEVPASRRGCDLLAH
ncbi:transposase [Streptomyces sp. Pv4-95]|uniref:transposase n=1 Tax=Streptomyces sp. Pv4-95 TaxID=3049543 RepID=UPI0038925F16